MSTSATSFSELGIPAALVTALSKMSITVPTPIQASAYPVLSEGKNAYLQAETGTGKTLAYLLPLFCKLNIQDPSTQIIILAPTHELAIQIQRLCTDLAQHSGMAVRTLLLIGGTSRERQVEKLKKKPHIVVGSTGRIRELIEDRKLKPHNVNSIVIDEADRLLTAENLPDLKGIFKTTKQGRQLVFVSATEHSESNDIIATLSSGVVPVMTAATPINQDIEHLYLTCEERDKPDLLRKLLHATTPIRALVFVHRNETAEIVAEKLAHHKIRVADIHGARDKTLRKQSMENFRSGKVSVLIASDVAARGLDIKDVTHVFNLDMPTESKAYLHRVGRTGRAGAKGTAISLLSGPQDRLVQRLQNELGITLTEIFLREGKIYAVEK